MDGSVSVTNNNNLPIYFGETTTKIIPKAGFIFGV